MFLFREVFHHQARRHVSLKSLLPYLTCRSLGLATTPVGTIEQLPVEAVSAVSRRSHGVVRFPNSVEEVIADTVGAGKKGSLRQRSASLLEQLRSRSRSVSRGGVQVLPAIDGHDNALNVTSPSTKARRNGRDSWQEKVQSLLKTSGSLNLEEAVLTAQPGESDWLSEPQTSGSARGQTHKRHLLYDENQAMAYVASRMPGCYAAVYNIMNELSVRLPKFQPQSMLDFGSGPGTAVWAAQEIWDRSIQDVLAVEASPAMTALGQRIQTARQRTLEDPSQPSQQARIRWIYRLAWHAMEGSSRGNRSRRRAPASSRQYDIVTSAYVIGELDTDEERRSVVDTLWASTKHLLILVEPGTPTGYANIMAARTQVLQASMEEESGKLGAHVVAPCPHDGICPMEVTRSWCHFAQRFERSSLQRITKIRPDGGMPRTYQDERYSYVVIRKQPRPEVSGALSVSRHRQDAAELESHTPYLPHPQSWRKNESKMRQAAALQKILDGMQDTEDAVEDGPSLEETTEQLIRESLQAGGDEDEDIELHALEDEKLTEEEATDAQELASKAAKDDELLPSENEKEGNPELSGIEDIQLGLPQDEGVKDTESLQAILENPDSDSDGEDSMVSSQMVAAAAADSWSWGRLIRHPRKRSKHVIFDVCAAKASVPPSSIPPQASRRVTERRRKGDRELGQEGALVRQVITRSDRQRWLGPAGYRLARKARWGDLWPTHYAQGSGS